MVNLIAAVLFISSSTTSPDKANLEYAIAAVELIFAFIIVDAAIYVVVIVPDVMSDATISDDVNATPSTPPA